MQRRRAWVVSGIVVFGWLGAACESEPELVDGVFTAAEWAKVNTLSPLPAAPPVPSNAYADHPGAATLGQKLFFDRRYSGPILSANNPWGAQGQTQQLNCTGCHKVEASFADDLETSTGAGALTGRNTLGLLNTAFYDWSGWIGFIDTMWGHAILAGPECGPCLNSSRLAVARHLFVNYREEYDAIFPTPLDPELDPAWPDEADGTRRFPLLAPEEFPRGKPGPADSVWGEIAAEDQELLNRITANYGKAVEAYTRKLISRDAPFDRYVAGETEAISESARRGLKLFVGKAACAECHAGPNFSDNKYHNVGVPAPARAIRPDGTFADLGHLDGMKRVTTATKIWSSDGPYSDAKSGRVDAIPTAPYPEEETGKYRTKGLRSVALTGPWMHSGSFKTLREVVELYNEGGAESGFPGVKSELVKPLNLSESEIDDLVAFLETLNGAPLPATLLESP